MHVAALLIAEHTDQKWNTVDIAAAPKFEFAVSELPKLLVIPVIAVVWSEPGEDTEAEIQLMCFAEGSDEVLGGKRNKWEWLEQRGVLTKYHVFTHGLEVMIDNPGLYYVGVGGDALGDESKIVPFVVTVKTAADEGVVADPFGNGGWVA
jgi:hypothetical protein